MYHDVITLARAIEQRFGSNDLHKYFKFEDEFQGLAMHVFLHIGVRAELTRKPPMCLSRAWLMRTPG